jgi:hypothetical protein
MRRLQIWLAAALVVIALGAEPVSVPSAAMAQDDAPAAPGHCQFSLKNQWAGPFKVCQSPLSAEQCAALGKTDENSNATWAAGACPTGGVVGSCQREKDTVYYYEGDASSLEMGCGFQGGTWKSGG